MRAWVGAVCLALLLVSAPARGQDRSPAARLAEALARARADGSLARATGEHYLLSARAAYLLRLELHEQGGLLVELETRFLAHHAPLFHDALSLSSTGQVGSMSCGLWLPAADGKEVRVARDEVGRLRWEVASTRVAGQGAASESGTLTWADDQLPYLVVDFLWPLIGEEGTLVCRRIGLLRQPQPGQVPLTNTPARVALERGETGTSAAVSWGKTSFRVERSPGGRLLGRKTGDVAGEAWEAVTRERFWAAVNAPR